MQKKSHVPRAHHPFPNSKIKWPSSVDSRRTLIQPEMLTILFTDQISSPSFGTQQESKGIAPKLEVSYHLILVQCNTSPTRQQNGDRYQEYVDFSKAV